MRSDVVRWRPAALLTGALLLLGACGHHHWPGAGDDDAPGINAFPTNYKSDVLGGMHAYLNDPTGIRDAAISEPALKTVDDDTRYVVCVQFNGKAIGGNYAGVKVLAAVFLGGHLDHFLEKSQEQCSGVTYTPFPELAQLPR